MSLIVFHPSIALVGTIDGLLQTLAPEIRYENIIVPDLLERTIQSGLTQAIRGEIETIFRKIPARSNTLVLCTCSTLGGCAEEVGQSLGLNVIRIDRPMAERAVEKGRKIGLAAALESTIEPTRELLEEVARARHKDIEIKIISCVEAWDHKKRGDDAGYIKTIVRYLEASAHEVDVIVLAQGSMAAAEEQCAHLATPILSSPRLAVEMVAEAMLRTPLPNPSREGEGIL